MAFENKKCHVVFPPKIVRSLRLHRKRGTGRALLTRHASLEYQCVAT